MKIKNLLTIPFTIILSAVILETAPVKAKDLPGMEIKRPTPGAIFKNPAVRAGGHIIERNKRNINNHVIKPAAGAAIGAFTNPTSGTSRRLGAIGGAASTCIGCHPNSK